MARAATNRRAPSFGIETTITEEEHLELMYNFTLQANPETHLEATLAVANEQQLEQNQEGANAGEENCNLNEEDFVSAFLVDNLEEGEERRSSDSQNEKRKREGKSDSEETDSDGNRNLRRRMEQLEVGSGSGSAADNNTYGVWKAVPNQPPQAP
ncbi:hypothetical protein CCACVL1_05080 [Corchorus capsularis]|uniref:Uncharacterized protein n=1 Tax=Corchorus capsularis TaxID=210143 RepID=A0A1R3JMI6_COCAP|nr:hypothetical protein CCACVL1_05080 [Corchorus capsularis]